MITEVVLPMLGITVENGKIVEWLKTEGDPVEKGEVLFVVEMEKVTTEVESPATGILAKILIPVGQEVPVLTPAAIITDPGEEIPVEYMTKIDAGINAETEINSELATENSAFSSPMTPISDEPLRIIPAARKLAMEKGINIKNVNATGPDGVILLKDIETAVTALTAKVSTLARRLAGKEDIPLNEIEGTGVRGRIMQADVQRSIREVKTPALGNVIPMNSMRQAIARRMSESAITAPHIHFFTDVKLDSLFSFRQDLLSDFEQNYGLRLSINDLIIKATALNILDFPILNATIRDQEIYISKEINVCLAVALPDGLIVPAIANADAANLAEIARQRLDLIQRAHSGSLTLAEIERGTFTISSLAQYDVTHFTAILNPPQSGILSVGKVRDELYLNNGEVNTRKVATFGLSVDHRIIDGVVAADFLQSLKQKLQKPISTFFNW